MKQVFFVCLFVLRAIVDIAFWMSANILSYMAVQIFTLVYGQECFTHGRKKFSTVLFS